jgi:beta-phosphoglucomutase
MGMSLTMLRAVIFDFDGVLVDSEPLHYQAFQEVLAPLGLSYSYERYVEHYIGFDDRDGFREAFGEAHLPLEAERLAQLLRAKARAFQRIVSRGVRPFPGALALVRDLSAHGVPLAIASGALRQEIAWILQALGIEQAFAIIVAADDVQQSKPHPETYQMALRNLQTAFESANIRSQNCLAIEDTANGILAARNAGLRCVAVTHSSPAASLQAADHTVESLAQLSFQCLATLLDAAPAQTLQPC